MPPPTDLLHDALHRATSRSRTGEGAPPLSPERLQALHLDEDDQLVEVRTPLPSAPSSAASTPSVSRSSSPSRKGKGGAGKPRRDKAKERAKAEANKNPFDPLIRFPGQVNGRIFGELGVNDLLACGLVCKRWRRSQTMNYTWYLLLQSLTYTTPAERKATYAQSTGLPTWRQGDANQDWAQHFANVMRRDDLESKEADVDENGLTMKEERELKWKEENEASEAGLDKVAMREYYKSLGNKKVKGKSFKGAVRTHEGDGLGDVATDAI
ncbi:hypothetical protein JCM1840_003577 [Sporobolomyces johnsonii]